MIAENGKLPPKCTPQNTAAIASDLAAKTYGLNCLNVGIEDDDTNFTRFLLLSRKAVHSHMNTNTPAKTSVVFTLHNTPGALYKALACFSLRDIDFSKIESRPTSASLLNFINQKAGTRSRNQADLPRFRYCFYLDFFVLSQLDGKAKNALAHLNEQADYVRILGSYPQKSKLVGDVAKSVEDLKRMVDSPKDVSIMTLHSDSEDTKPLNVGLVGFDGFGQLLAQLMLENNHRVSFLDQKSDHSSAAKKLGVEYF